LANLNNTAVDSIKSEAIEALKKQKIFFGHASVGFNIIDGIEEIKAKTQQLQGIQLRELKKNFAIENTGIYHARNGKNGFPKIKCDSFKEFLEKEELGTKFDIAFFKFCYVDINQTSNVLDVFKYYVNTYENLKENFPRLVLVHVTIPLCVHSWGLRGFVRKLIKPDLANIYRNQYNDLLRKKYQGQEPIYDLARVESTYPDGKNAFFKHNGKQYAFLINQYTNDGGHLNSTGKNLAAQEFLRVLADISISVHRE